MKKYVIKNKSSFSGDLKMYLITYDVGLAAALGSVGYSVLINRKEGQQFPVFKIEFNNNTGWFINKYYQNDLMVDAYVFASNMEILGGIIPHYLEQRLHGNKMPLKISPKPKGWEGIKEVQEAEESTEEQLRDFYDEQAEEFYDCSDDDDILYNIPEDPFN